MEKKINEVQIFEYASFLPKVLCFRFFGEFTPNVCKEACQDWRKEFERNQSRTNYTLVWDCIKIDRFDIRTGVQWMRCVRDYAWRISKVIIISDSILIRGLAMLMLKAYRFDMEILKEVDRIKLAEHISYQDNTRREPAHRKTKQ